MSILFYFVPVRHPFLLLTVLCSALLAACNLTAIAPGQSTESGEQPPSATLSVFAAASLTESFGTIAQNFEAQHPEVHIVLNLAGSQQLAQQIAQGASADVFASADRKQIDAIVDVGRIDGSTSQEFARNQLVIIFPEENSTQIQNIQDLTRPGLRLVIADSAVPVGAYTMQFLEQAAQHASLGETFRNGFVENVVSYEENVRAVLSKVILGEADAGIVYSTDYAGASDESIHALEIPKELNVTASYILAPINDSRQPELAKSFIEFVLAPQGQAILSEYGFLPID
jgi:molybdate transport system substrate-binding protein